MTSEERVEAILKSAEWWDADLLVSAARGWYQDWRSQIRRIPPSQWGAARRVGASVERYRDFREAWEEFFWGKKGPDGERHGGVVDRDRRRRGWGQPVLADDLLVAISRASEPQVSDRVQAFAEEAKRLGAQAEERLQEWRRLKQARLFLDFVLTMIQVEMEPK